MAEPKWSEITHAGTWKQIFFMCENARNMEEPLDVPDRIMLPVEIKLPVHLWYFLTYMAMYGETREEDEMWVAFDRNEVEPDKAEWSRRRVEFLQAWLTDILEERLAVLHAEARRW